MDVAHSIEGAKSVNADACGMTVAAATIRYLSISPERSCWPGHRWGNS